MGRSASPLCHRLAIAAGRTAPTRERGGHTQHRTAHSSVAQEWTCRRSLTLSINEADTLRRPSSSTQAGRQASARPAAPLSSCDSIPSLHLLRRSHLDTDTRTEERGKPVDLSLSLLRGKISADRELSLQTSLQRTDLRTKTTRLARQVTRRSTGEGSASFRHLSAFLITCSFLQKASIQAACS